MAICRGNHLELNCESEPLDNDRRWTWTWNSEAALVSGQISFHSGGESRSQRGLQIIEVGAPSLGSLSPLMGGDPWLPYMLLGN